MSAYETVRADVWLWRARFFKTRSLATRFLTASRVRLTRGGETRIIAKPSLTLLPGDRLTLPLRRGIVQIEILGLGVRRGPPAEARALYADLASGVGETPCSTHSNAG